ncbi:mannosyltransferase [Myotisia sp. PD_48]|nr:mannosyltransferase [Myotisia sp. PD_48]
MSSPSNPASDLDSDSDSDSSHSQPVPSQFYLPLNVVFYLCLLSNTLAASLSPIQDCDEVFNYWEPTHYLTHGSGFQTWEYSPDYSIRSWLYISIHTVIAKTLGLLARTKSAQFYMVRLALGLVCTICETRAFAAVSRSLNPRVGLIFLLILVFSPGMFHASTALLPSSFAMYTSMLGLASFLEWKGGSKLARGILWFGIGGMVGWPFSAALMVPFVLEDVVVSWSLGNMRPVILMVLKGVANCLKVLCGVVLVDSLFYRKLVFVPWNIIAYNVFGGAGKGPNIFGTEPPTFYFKNLLLNFNLWSLLALAGGPLLVLQALFRPHKSSRQTLLRSITLVLPFYSWLAIFTLQPHKEERFMYPAYPFLALNAAIGFHIILAYIGSSSPGSLIGHIPVKFKMMAVSICVLVAINIGILRIAGVVTAYSAPLQIFDGLQYGDGPMPEGFVCYGKEWYRFPSSFFLPNDNLRAKFIKSEFEGLLPGEFAESRKELGPYPGTWMTPKGMNDLNQEDPDKYIPISRCDYLVDSYFPGDSETDLEPHYILDSDSWEKLSCKPFLDNRRTGFLGRVLWVPSLPFVPKKYQREWGQYCLLKRRYL